MTEETRKPTMRIVLEIYDRDVVVSGEHLELLRNSVIFNIDKQIKRAAKKAKRTFIRDQRMASGIDDVKATEVIEEPKIETQVKSTTPINDALKNLGIKLK